MIFRSQHALKEQLQQHPTRTTNGVEAFHRDLYRIVEKAKPVIDTLKQIFSYLRVTERDLERIDKGASIDYKQAPKRYVPNESSIIYINMRHDCFFSEHRKAKAVIANDGRAPDTVEKLLGECNVYLLMLLLNSVVLII